MNTEDTPAMAEAGQDDSALRCLDGRVTLLWRVAMLIRTVVLTAIVLGAQGVLDPPVPTALIPTVVAALGIATVLFLPQARFRSWGYQVRADDLFVRRGVLWRIASVIPHTRIQHVDTRRGPLERWLGLSSIVVYTAGIRGADVTIPGLARADAELLRDHLAALGGGGDAV